MNSDKLFNALPHVFFGSLKEKMILGSLPSDAVEDILKPLLRDYHKIMPRLPTSLQKDIRSILRIYPEIAEEYGLSPVSAYAVHLSALERFKEAFSQFPNTTQDFFFKVKQNIAWLSVPVLTLAAYMFVFVIHSNPVLLSSREMIESLAEDVRISEEVRPDLTIPARNLYGFSALESFQKKSFRLGFHVACINLALTGNYPEYVPAHISFLKTSLETEDPELNLGKYIEKFEGSLQKNGQTDLLRLSKQIEALMEQKNSTAVYRMGEWCAVSRMVILSGDRDIIKTYLDGNARLEIVRKSLNREELPQGVVVAMDEIIKIAGVSSLTAIDIRALNRQIECIIRLMK